MGTNNIKKYCQKCGNELTGKQIKFCSKRCGKIYLKSLYRKRNREKINQYNREYNKRGIRGHPSDNNHLKQFLLQYPICQKCGTDKNINICHIKPRHKGGKHKDNLITLCQTHHAEFDACLSPFWNYKYHQE